MSIKDIAAMRLITTLGLIWAVFVSSSTVALATPGGKLAGEIIVSGKTDTNAVTLNGERALSGKTFFSAGVISTSEAGSATVNLGKLGSINLSPNSVLSLSFTENNISGNLSAGQIKVFAREGVAVNIQTVDGLVNSAADQTNVYTIDVQSGSTQTLAEQGSVFLNDGQTNVPQPQSSNKNRFWIPVLIASAIAATVVIVVLASRDDDDEVVSPTR